MSWLGGLAGLVWGHGFGRHGCVDDWSQQTDRQMVPFGRQAAGWFAKWSVRNWFGWLWTLVLCRPLMGVHG